MPKGCRQWTTIDLVGGIYCHICDTIFGSKSDYELHYILHEKADVAIQYSCVVCHRTITGYSKFRNHCYNMHTNANKFKCDHCDKSFHKQGVLDLHVKTVHTFKCKQPNCRKQFPTEQKLHMHEFIHKSKANKPPYNCKICNDVINGIDECEKHTDDHSVICYYCPICCEELNTETAMKHLITHFGSDNIENNIKADEIKIKVEEIKFVDADYNSITIAGGILCHLCQDVSKNRQEQDAHFHQNHPDNDITYTCLICNKQYEKYNLFGSHVYDHLWKNKFECEHCPQLFPRLSLLVQHVSAAHESAGLPCSSCDHTFATERHRKQHMKTHHQIQQLTCPHQGCQSTFESPKELHLHEKVHKGVADTWCRRCGLDLGSAAAAARHLPVHAARSYSCPVCAVTYNAKEKERLVSDHIPRHFESVFYMCNVCAKVFANLHRFKAHLKIHTPAKNYECNHCGRSFAKTNHLQQHLAMHSGMKPYKCTKCDKSFANYPNYNKHMRKIHKVDTKTLKKADVDKKMVLSDSNITQPNIKDDKKVITQAEPLEPNVGSDPSSMDPDSIDSIEIDKDSHIFKNLMPADCSSIIEFDSDLEDMVLEPTVPAAETVSPLELGSVLGAAGDALDPLPPGCLQLEDPPLPHVDPRLTVLPTAPPPLDNLTTFEAPQNAVIQISPVAAIPNTMMTYDLPLPFPYDSYDDTMGGTIESPSKYDAPVLTKIYCGLHGMANISSSSANKLRSFRRARGFVGHAMLSSTQICIELTSSFNSHVTPN